VRACAQTYLLKVFDVRNNSGRVLFVLHSDGSNGKYLEGQMAGGK
jgi:hypothetical protein